MELKFHIPDPCQEEWSQMLPEGQGKHCLVCSKTVVDFTGWEAEEISAYLMARSGQRICGRFKASQLEASKIDAVDNLITQIAGSGLSFIKKIAAVVILVFAMAGTSCEGGKLKMHDSVVKVDTTSPVFPETTGVILYPDSLCKKDSATRQPAKRRKNKLLTRHLVPAETGIMGDMVVEMIPDSLLKKNGIKE